MMLSGITTSNHPSESGGHWYDRNGAQVVTVAGAKGQPVKPDIRHARKLGLLPGVTSVVNCAAKPGLDFWKQEQVLLAALTLPRREGEEEQAYLSRIMQDSQEQGRKAADRGTAIHAAIQSHFQGEAPSEDLWPIVKFTVAALEKHCGQQDWIAEESFGCEIGYGGKADLHCQAWLLDFKSKDSKDLDDPAKKLVYDEHSMQLAAYRRGLGIPVARCANVFVSRDEPHTIRFCEHTEEELSRGLEMFDCLMSFWQKKNRYDSSFSLRLAA